MGTLVEEIVCTFVTSTVEGWRERTRCVITRVISTARVNLPSSTCNTAGAHMPDVVGLGVQGEGGGGGVERAGCQQGTAIGVVAGVPLDTRSE